MIARRPLSKPPYFDIRPRPPCAKGYELYHPVGVWREGQTKRQEAIHDRLTSVHEAAHAVVAIHFNMPFKKVWLSYPKTERGNIRFSNVGPFGSNAAYRMFCHDEAVISLAGREAERRYAPRSNWRIRAGYEGLINGVAQVIPDSDADHACACLDALSYRNGEASWDACDRFVGEARALVKKLWPEIKITAAALLERKTLTERQVRKLINRPHRGLARHETDVSYFNEDDGSYDAVLAGAGTEWVCSNYAARDVANLEDRGDEPPELARLPGCDCDGYCKVSDAGIMAREYSEYVSTAAWLGMKREAPLRLAALAFPTKESSK